MTSAFHFTLVNLGERYTTRRLLVSSGVAWSRERGNVENRDITQLSNQTYTLGTARTDTTLMMTAHNTLDLGGDYRHVRQGGMSTEFVYAPQLTSSVDRSSGTSNEEGMYVQDSLTLSRTRLIVGVRRDEHNLVRSMAAQPYASVLYDSSKHTRLEFDWGRDQQFPELNQVFSIFAAGRLRPETATHYDASVERRLNSRTRLRFEVYDREDRDLLARPLIDPRLAPDGAVVNAVPDAPLVNSQYGYARGAEVVVQRRTANGFTGWVSYAYGRAVLRDRALGLVFPSDYDQRHTMNLYVSRRLRPTVNFSGHVTYGSGMPLPGFYRRDNAVYDLSGAERPAGTCISTRRPQSQQGVRPPDIRCNALRRGRQHHQSRESRFRLGRAVRSENGPHQPKLLQHVPDPALSRNCRDLRSRTQAVAAFGSTRLPRVQTTLLRRTSRSALPAL